MSSHYALPAAMLLFGSLCSVGQTTLRDQQISRELKSNKVIFIDGKPTDSIAAANADSVREAVATFYYDQFRHFQDPGAPYFLFLSKDAQLAMGIGGCVRMRAYYDWDGAIPSPGFAPYLIPMTPDPGNMKNFGTSPAGTCLFFRVLGSNKTLGKYQLYIEANFNGYERRDFRLKKAYAIINDFTVGYAPSTFSDPAAQPPTVDAQGPNNKISPTRVLLRYMPVIKKRWYLAVSAETPEASVNVDNVAIGKVSNKMPDFAAFAQYEWARGQHVRVAGIYRTLGYRDLTAGRNHFLSGWGLQLSTVANPMPQLTFYGSVNYGKGYAGLGGDLLIGGYDLVGDPDRPGKMYAPASLGWCAGVSYNILPELFMSVTASQTRYLPKHDVDGEEYKYGLLGAVNIFWNMTPRIQLGAEFDIGKRQNFNRRHSTAQRVGAMCQFSF